MRSLSSIVQSNLDSCFLILVFLLGAFLGNPLFLKIILATITIFFTPGYLFLKLLFRRENRFSKRFLSILSLGLSVIISGISLLLLFLIFKVNEQSVTITFSVLIFVLSVTSINLEEEKGKLSAPFKKIIGSQFTILGVSKHIAILLVLISLSFYFHNTQKQGPEYVEFYLLDSDGKLENYPLKALVNEPVTVKVGVTNAMDKPTVFHFNVMVNHEIIGIKGPILLQPKQNWEFPLELYFPQAQNNNKAEFNLFLNNSEAVSKSLALWVDVME